MVKNTDSETPSVQSKGSIGLGTVLGPAKQYALAIVLIILAFVVGCGSFFSVGAGVVGVTFNSITGDTAAYSQGMYFKIPIVTSVIKFDVKTQREDIQADSASKDLQKVKVHVAINYHLDYKKVNELYVKVGRDFNEKVIHPAVNESVKASVAQFPVEEIIVKREDVKILIEKSLKDRLAIYNIILESVNLVNISFDEEFNKVVEQKQIEEQKIKTAEYIKKQAEQKKQATILEAEGEARKQELLRATISKDTVMMKWIDKWDGKLPTYMMGNKTMMMVPGDNK